jgi:hypothetical protein
VIEQEVASKHKEIQMREALQEAPKGLFETIQHTLDRTRSDLSEQDAEDFELLLSWVTCAKRPFKLGELEDVLKFCSKDGEGVVYLEGELRKRYASFFNVNREDGRSTEDLQMEQVVLNADDDDAGEIAVKLVHHDAGTAEDFGEAMDIDSDPRTTEITLSHASFGDFFRRHRTAEGSGTDWSLWNLKIVKHLLRMLCDKEVLEKWKSNPLSGYASCYWRTCPEIPTFYYRFAIFWSFTRHHSYLHLALTIILVEIIFEHCVWTFMPSLLGHIERRVFC